MATTKLEKAVDFYVDKMSHCELREFVFNQMLDNFENEDQLNRYLFHVKHFAHHHNNLKQVDGIGHTRNVLLQKHTHYCRLLRRTKDNFHLKNHYSQPNPCSSNHQFGGCGSKSFPTAKTQISFSF